MQAYSLRQLAKHFGRSKIWLKFHKDKFSDDFPKPIGYARNWPRYPFDDFVAWMDRHGIDPNIKRSRWHPIESVKPKQVDHEPDEDEETTSVKLKTANAKFVALLKAERGDG